MPRHAGKQGKRRCGGPTAKCFDPAGRNGLYPDTLQRKDVVIHRAGRESRTARRDKRAECVGCRQGEARSPEVMAAQQAFQPATRIGQVVDFESEARHGKAKVGRRGDVGTPVGGKSGERTVRSLPLGERSDGAHQHEKRHEQGILYPNQHLANLAFAPRIYNSFGEKKIFRPRKIARAGRSHEKNGLREVPPRQKRSSRCRPEAIFRQIETPKGKSSIFFRNFGENTDDP